MKQSKITSIFYLLATFFMLGLAGCERPVEKGVADWKAEGNIDALIVALDSLDRRINIPAAQALGELRAEQAVKPLAAQFTNPNSQLVVAAIQALISIGSESAEAYLVDALELKDTWSKTMAINGLGTLKSTQAIEPLIDILNTPDDRISTAAAVALGQINDKKAIAALATKIESPSYSLRLACVESIGSIGGEEAAEALLELIGDRHRAVREIAIDTLIANREIAAPYALTALHGKNEQGRQSAVTILESIDAVPTKGKIRIFYLIAQIPPQTEGVDLALVSQLADMGNDAVEILIKAVAHTSANVREHAFRALEIIGEPCVAQTVQAVETRATPAGKQWFNKRSSWEGAPSWRLDLWGAATALNPAFKHPYTQQNNMTEEEYAIQTLRATQSEVPREYIPLLIPLLVPVGAYTDNTPNEPDSIGLFGSSFRSKKTIVDFQEFAKQRLISAGDIALFPLIAATHSSSKQMADSCRELLLQITAPSSPPE